MRCERHAEEERGSRQSRQRMEVGGTYSKLGKQEQSGNINQSTPVHLSKAAPFTGRGYGRGPEAEKCSRTKPDLNNLQVLFGRIWEIRKLIFLLLFCYIYFFYYSYILWGLCFSYWQPRPTNRPSPHNRTFLVPNAPDEDVVSQGHHPPPLLLR